MPAQAARGPRPRPTFRTVHVRRVDRPTPRAVRVTFTGEELRGFSPQGPATHIKLLFPPPGESRPVVPNWGPNGPELPPGAPRPIPRTYTPRRWDPESLELEVHFMAETGGPGARWARAARPGDTVVVAGPSGPYRRPPEARWLVIAGDESALPAIGTILESLDASVQADVYVEVADADEEQPLASKAPLTLTWLHRSRDETDLPGRLLERALRDVRLPPGPGAVWVGCEATIMRQIKRHLLYERGMARELLCTRGYWKAGVANHPDHDTGDDV